jgi:signal transduction histidine kinase
LPSHEVAIGIRRLGADLAEGPGTPATNRCLTPQRRISRIGSSSGHDRPDLDQRLALERPEDELKELSDTIDALLDRLETSFASQRLFVANASHELRTPLTRLKTLIQVALADPDATLSSVRLAQQRGTRRRTTARTAARAGTRRAGRRTPRTAWPRRGHQRVLQNRAREIDHRQLRANATLDHALIYANQQIIANLLDNAIVHNTPTGWLQVTSATLSGSPIFTIANSGPTISPTDLERIQQPFQRRTGGRTSRGDSQAQRSHLR